MGYKVVVAGATGNVGREMLNILAEREFPVDEIAALASRRSLGTEVSFGDKTLKTQDLATFDFSGWDIALFAIGSDATKEFAPKAAAAGCVVIAPSTFMVSAPSAFRSALLLPMLINLFSLCRCTQSDRWLFLLILVTSNLLFVQMYVSNVAVSFVMEELAFL